MANLNQTIIVKKIKKVGGGHHGGAWKVAYADFVTAMMAFFLLLWLLNSVTQEQLEGIANHFAPISVSESTSGAGGVLGGKSMSEEGAMESASARASVTMDLAPPRAGSGGEAAETKDEEHDDEEELQKREDEQFRQAEESLRKAIESIPSLKRLAKSLLIDNTPEGLRIQIVDQKGLAMFPSGGAKMYLHTRKVLELVAKVILTMPQKLAISGHTDAVRFVSDTGYSNWELSSDRANASRRALIELGVPFERIARVVGKAATEPLVVENPGDHRNRRLSIILLRGTGQKPAKKPAEKAEQPPETESAAEPEPQPAAESEPETEPEPAPEAQPVPEALTEPELESEPVQ